MKSCTSATGKVKKMVSIHYPSGLQKKKCSLCGKEFYITLGNDYAYKIKAAGRVKLFCSWKCLREKQHKH